MNSNLNITEINFQNFTQIVLIQRDKMVTLTSKLDIDILINYLGTINQNHIDENDTQSDSNSSFKFESSESDVVDSESEYLESSSESSESDEEYDSDYTTTNQEMVMSLTLEDELSETEQESPLLPDENESPTQNLLDSISQEMDIDRCNDCQKILINQVGWCVDCVGCCRWCGMPKPKSQLSKGNICTGCKRVIVLRNLGKSNVDKVSGEVCSVLPYIDINSTVSILKKWCSVNGVSLPPRGEGSGKGGNIIKKDIQKVIIEAREKAKYVFGENDLYDLVKIKPQGWERKLESDDLKYKNHAILNIIEIASDLFENEDSQICYMGYHTISDNFIVGFDASNDEGETVGVSTTLEYHDGKWYIDNDVDIEGEYFYAKDGEYDTLLRDKNIIEVFAK